MYDANLVLKSANEVVHDAKREFEKQNKARRSHIAPNILSALKNTSLFNKEEEEERNKKQFLKNSMPLKGSLAVIQGIKRNKTRRKKDIKER